MDKTAYGQTAALVAQCEPAQHLLVGCGVLLMLVTFDAQWFQSYCKSVLEGNRKLTRLHLPEAYRAINEALRSPETSPEERKSLREALHFLDLIERVELQKAS